MVRFMTEVLNFRKPLGSADQDESGVWQPSVELGAVLRVRVGKLAVTGSAENEHGLVDVRGVLPPKLVDAKVFARVHRILEGLRTSGVHEVHPLLHMLIELEFECGSSLTKI
jgi:hypothetical protein